VNLWSTCRDIDTDFFCGATALSEPGPSRYRGFMNAPRHTTLGRTPLDEWPARRRDLYLTTNNIYKRQASIPPAGFEPAIPKSKQPQTHALDRAGTWLGRCCWYSLSLFVTHLSNAWCVRVRDWFNWLRVWANSSFALITRPSISCPAATQLDLLTVIACTVAFGGHETP
jgi:hypothetical protein